MSQVLIAFSTWLHALSTVVFIGYFVLLVLVLLPALAPADLSRISKTSRPWLYIAMLVFAVTGTHLMLVDPAYQGYGNFSSPWAILILVKHILIVVMLMAGFWFNALLRIGPLLVSNSAAARALVRFRQYAWLMAVMGILVLLLTAFSQLE